jgi:penicillin amidase
VVFAALTLAAPTVTTNAVQLDFDHGRVTITRDEYGAPHVVGSSLEAVWFGVGYAQAQDRLWQAETLRRAATGTSAEIQGASGSRRTSWLGRSSARLRGAPSFSITPRRR